MSENQFRIQDIVSEVSSYSCPKDGMSVNMIGNNEADSRNHATDEKTGQPTKFPREFCRLFSFPESQRRRSNKLTVHSGQWPHTDACVVCMTHGYFFKPSIFPT